MENDGYGQLINNLNEELKELNRKYSAIEKKIENLDRIERMHFEFDRNRVERIDKKEDSNFIYLDSKIDKIQNNLILQISDLFEKFFVTTSKFINNLENKMKNEIEERKTDINKVKSLNDYDRIILKELESRISILEEESEKYIVN